MMKDVRQLKIRQNGDRFAVTTEDDQISWTGLTANDVLDIIMRFTHDGNGHSVVLNTDDIKTWVVDKTNHLSSMLERRLN